MDGRHSAALKPFGENGSFNAAHERADGPYEWFPKRNDYQKEDAEDDDGEAGDLENDNVCSDKDRGQREEDFLYKADLEARAAVKFNKIIFCKEFIYHMFFPLSAPLMYYLDGGWYALINRGFIGWDSIFLIASQWIWAANFYLLNVVSLIYIVEAKHADFLYDVLLVDLLWGMRNLVVATKYAFLSQIEMKEMQTKKVPPYVHKYRTVRAAWQDPIPRRVLQYELLLAALRNKLTSEHSFSLDTSFDSSEAIRDMVLDLQVPKNDFHSLSFSYGKRADKWLEVGCQELTKEAKAWAEPGHAINVKSLPIRLYAAHVIRQASSLSRLKRLGHTLLSQHLRKCAAVLGLIHAVLPVGAVMFLCSCQQRRISCTYCRTESGELSISLQPDHWANPVPGPKWATYCVLVPTFVLTLFAMVSNVSFMMIGVLDFRRRHFIAQSLDELLRTGVYTGSQHVRGGIYEKESSLRYGFFSGLLALLKPQNDPENSIRSGSSGTLSGEGVFFDFSNPDSLLAWWNCRQLMLNFGFGFYKRIQYYTTYFAGYCAILLMFVLVKMITGIRRTDFYLLVTVIFSIDVFLTLLALMVWPGGDTNSMLQLHGATLVRRKIITQVSMVQDGKYLSSDRDLKMSRATSDTISSITEAVKWDNAKSRLSVCGFEARDQLVSLIVAVVTASISIGIGQIIQNGVKL